MRFDVNRLSQLAGIGKRSDRLLSEAGNRSYHDGVASDTVDERWGKNQLNEKRPALRQYEDQKYGVDDEGEPTNELNDAYFLGELDDDTDDDGKEENVGHETVLEIDEGMLRREIRRMKSERMNENKLRLAVRNEIHDIFDDLGISDSSWVYGNNKPRNSKQGRVNMSFTGPGFW